MEKLCRGGSRCSDNFPVTLDDFERFKHELLDEIRKLMANQHAKSNDRRWLKSSEVRSLLKISPGTLQTLRTNGILPYSKMGGALHYDINEIRNILERR